ncbi:hypothetical protein ScPMuIL_013256 [Solemya velum]
MSNSSDGEIEEMLVIVELSGIIESDFLTKTTGKCRMLGIETEKPLFELDSMVFQGEYKDTVGTSLLFEETKQSEAASTLRSMTLPDANAAPDKFLEHRYKVDKKLCMQRVFLAENNPAKTIDQDVDSLLMQDESTVDTDKGAMENVAETTAEEAKRLKLDVSRR